MVTFRVTQKSKRSRARLGRLTTPHGVVETPTLVPVATQGVVKTLTSEEAEATDAQLLIANTFHLHLKPGEKVVKKAGGLHEFMQWERPLMTDSGGYQVFSLGFGRDHGTGKIMKTPTELEIRSGQQPQHLKITDTGVTFRSPLDGNEVFIGPKESMKIQAALGADIIFAFDECTSPLADEAYTRTSLERTHRWAEVCLKQHRTKQALYGIIQGGKFETLRKESAQVIGAMPFAGFGIGGEFGGDKRTMVRMLRLVTSRLPAEKPRHLLGIGHLEDIPRLIKEGIDTFDCIVPTHYARHGVAFIQHRQTGAGFTRFARLDLMKKKLLRDRKPLDPKCACFVCQKYTRAYITHLFRAKEITALRLTTFHNLFFFNQYVAGLRDQIKRGRL